VDDSISIVTATISATNATAEPISHGLVPLMPKPASATISHIAAANSAMSANPCKVTMALGGGAWPFGAIGPQARSTRRSLGENALQGAAMHSEASRRLRYVAAV
jgi:hypothetical protein